MRKKLICCVLALVICGSVAGCSGDDLLDQVADFAQSEDEHVLSVKNGTPVAYPDKTFGEAFEFFFSQPAWKYFVGVKEGPDDDGDGEPDYTEDDIEIVEFTGYCMYKDVEVKALIQFTLSKDDDTFQATYLSFNEIPQSNLILSALLEKAFSEGDSEAEEQAKQEQNEEAQESAGEDRSAEFTGSWEDTVSQRCYMDIGYESGIYYIDINWSSGAVENTHWTFTGTYDDEDGVIYYQGSRIEETYTEDGMQEAYGYTDGDGILYIGDDGMLYWDDFVEGMGANCVFEKQ